MEIIIGYTALLIMGFVLGLLGGGGSILTVPILVYFFQISPTLATSYSLLIVGLSAAIGTIFNIRKNSVSFKIGILFVIPSILGVSFSRGHILPLIPNTIFKTQVLVVTKEMLIITVFALIMIAASLSMIYKTKLKEKKIQSHFNLQPIQILFQGFFVGTIAGFVGAGGGFLIIPSLMAFAGLNMSMAIGTSLMIIAMQSLFGFIGDIYRGEFIDWLFAFKLVIIAIFGMIFGSLFVNKFSEIKLQVTFGWFVLLTGSAIFLQQLFQQLLFLK